MYDTVLPCSQVEGNQCVVKCNPKNKAVKVPGVLLSLAAFAIVSLRKSSFIILLFPFPLLLFYRNVFFFVLFFI